MTTYPRTDSPYLTSDLYNELPSRISALYQLGFINAQSTVDLNQLPKRCINDDKAPNHHAIIPTDDLSAYSNLSQDERSLFELISTQFIAAFSTPCTKHKTKYVFSSSGNEFVSYGMIIAEPSWRSILVNHEAEQKDPNKPQITHYRRFPKTKNYKHRSRFSIKNKPSLNPFLPTPHFQN